MPARALLSLLATLFLATPASAAPMSGTATFSITIGSGPYAFPALTVGAPGLIDITAGVVSLPAGLVTQTGGLLIPVTSSSAVDSVSLVGFANLSGLFSVGGVTAQAPGEVCPGGMAASEVACNVGGAVGGIMGLTGTINVNVIPNIVVIPIKLSDTHIGEGGAFNAPFSFDAAAWTTGTGLLNTGVNTAAISGFGTSSGFQLVSPLFVAACGNLLPIFTTFSITGLTAVPEPAIWISVWLGLAGIVALTRKR
jgi:hypothetical protein